MSSAAVSSPWLCSCCLVATSSESGLGEPLASSLMDSVVQEEFEEHAEKAKTLPDTTTNENKLILYRLYKQATVGDVNIGCAGYTAT
ncbi:unnamed protein product [Miscanthus lutarioriparius]|uniref:ACB domain-containing protein n=1 Tax=Miscanthus lutarioriparius TaxID=422564 RepID=A0A811SGV4_9POAL|nr:unnamed protein product [Miscanthus lutarioriparius]